MSTVRADVVYFLYDHKSRLFWHNCKNTFWVSDDYHNSALDRICNAVT